MRFPPASAAFNMAASARSNTVKQLSSVGSRFAMPMLKDTEPKGLNASWSL